MELVSLTCRILIAEDDPAGREMVTAFLKLRGYVVSAAPDGEAAISMARQFHPEVVLTDICMPGVSGVELCRRLGEDPQTRGVPVLAMTALAGEQLDQLARAGFTGILTKPFELDELEHHIAVACEVARKTH